MCRTMTLSVGTDVIDRVTNPEVMCCLQVFAERVVHMTNFYFEGRENAEMHRKKQNFLDGKALLGKYGTLSDI